MGHVLDNYHLSRCPVILYGLSQLKHQMTKRPTRLKGLITDSSVRRLSSYPSVSTSFHQQIEPVVTSPLQKFLFTGLMGIKVVSKS